MAGQNYNINTKLNMNTSDFNKGVAAAQSQSRKLNKGMESDFSSLLSVVKGSFGGIIGVVGAGVSSVAIFKGIIESTNLTADKFAEMMQETKSATDAFFKSIATGDFSNLIDNMYEAIKLGEEYYRIMDDLGDRKNSMNILDAKSRIEYLENEKVLNDVNASQKDRISAANRMIEIEKENAERRKQIYKDEIDAKLNYYGKLNKLDKEKLKDMLENYPDFAEKFSKSFELMNLEGRARAAEPSITYVAPGVSVQTGNAKAYDELMNKVKELRNETKGYYNDFLAFESLSDDERKDLTDTLINYYNSVSSFDEQTLNASRKLSRLLKTNNKEFKTNTEITLGDFEKLNSKIKSGWEKVRNDFANGLEIDNDFLLQLGLWEKQLEDINNDTKIIQDRMKNGFSNITPLTPKGINLPSFNNNNLETGSFMGDEFSPPEFDYEFTGYLEELNNVARLTTSAIDTLGDAFINMAETGEFSFKSLLQTTLQGIRQIVMAKLAEAIMGQAAANSKFGLPGLAMTAGAIIGLQAIFASLPKFSTGGIVGGTSYSGDKVPILANSKEMILNQTQQANLFSYLNKDLNKPSNNQVEFIIRGDNLYGVLNKHNKKINTYI